VLPDSLERGRLGHPVRGHVQPRRPPHRVADAVQACLVERLVDVGGLEVGGPQGHPCGADLAEFLEVHDPRLPVQLTVREPGADQPSHVRVLHQEERVRQHPAQLPQRGLGVERDRLEDLVPAVQAGIEPQGHRPVRAHRVALVEGEGVEHGSGGDDAAPRRDHHVRPRRRERRHGVDHPRRRLTEVGQQGAVDVERDHQVRAGRRQVVGDGEGHRQPPPQPAAMTTARPAVVVIAPPARAPRAPRGRAAARWGPGRNRPGAGGSRASRPASGSWPACR